MLIQQSNNKSEWSSLLSPLGYFVVIVKLNVSHIFVLILHFTDTEMLKYHKDYIHISKKVTYVQYSSWSQENPSFNICWIRFRLIKIDFSSGVQLVLMMVSSWHLLSQSQTDCQSRIIFRSIPVTSQTKSDTWSLGWFVYLVMFLKL